MTSKEWVLIDRYITGIISEEEFALLQRQLHESPELRAAFRKAASLDIALHDLHSMDPKLSDLLAFDFSNAPKPIKGPSSWWSHSDLWRLVAAIALLFSVVQFFYSPQVAPAPDRLATIVKPAEPAAVAPVVIAKVIQTEKCVWTDPQKALIEGAALGAGEVELLSGTLVFAINNGPRIALTGPAKLNLVSENKAYLDHGYLSFQNFLISNSFDLTTPKSLLTDIGTEYAVSVSSGGEVIHVIGGEVWRTNLKEEEDVSFLGKGETGVFGPNQDASKLLSYIETTKRLLNETDENLQQPYAYDSFDYAGTTGDVINNLNGGFGWQLPWEFQIRELDKSPPKIERLKLAARPGGPSSLPSAAKALGISGDSVMKRSLAEPVNVDADATYYLSLIYKTPEFTADDRMMLLLKLRDSLNKQDLLIGINQNNQIVCRFDRSSRSTSPVTTEGEVLLVAKITIHKNGPDSIDIAALNAAEDMSVEPTQWSLNRELDLNGSIWDMVIMHVFSEKPVLVDDVRISKTWRGLFN